MKDVIRMKTCHESLKLKVQLSTEDRLKLKMKISKGKEKKSRKMFAKEMKNAKICIFFEWIKKKLRKKEENLPEKEHETISKECLKEKEFKIRLAKVELKEFLLMESYLMSKAPMFFFSSMKWKLTDWKWNRFVVFITNKIIFWSKRPYAISRRKYSSSL